MNKFLAAGASALFLVACTKEASTAAPPSTPPAAGAPAPNQVVGNFDLGKSI